MRPHLNERAQQELLEITKVLGDRSPNHTLHKLISSQYNELIVNAQIGEVKKIGTTGSRTQP